MLIAMANTDWVHDLKVVELKEECKKRGLPVGGKKAELVERLEDYIKANEVGGRDGLEGAPGEVCGAASRRFGGRVAGGSGAVQCVRLRLANCMRKPALARLML